jgi:phosphatidylglycerol---prolipoprotein diacylglyceryl transferase
MIDISFEGITLGPLMIRFYSVMILSGLLAGVVLGQREAKRLGENPDHVVNIAVLGAIFGLIGARLYHVFDQNHLPYYRDNASQIFAIWQGGIGIFGAVAGAALALVVYVWWVNRRAAQERRGAGKRMDVLRWFDIGAPAFLLGQAIGRWGNYFNQELFGHPTDLPWGLEIDPPNRPPEFAEAELFHPTFLYEMLWNLALIGLLLWLDRKRVLPKGSLFLVYIAGYAAGRFWIELLRIDTEFRLLGLSRNAWFSVAAFAVALALLLLRRRAAVRPEPAEGPG